jgi:hypothetical protein
MQNFASQGVQKNVLLGVTNALHPAVELKVTTAILDAFMRSYTRIELEKLTNKISEPEATARINEVGKIFAELEEIGLIPR